MDHNPASFLSFLFAIKVPHIISDLLGNSSDSKFLVALSVLAVSFSIMYIINKKTSLHFKNGYFILLFYLIIIPFTAIGFIPWLIGIPLLALMLILTFMYQRKIKIKMRSNEDYDVM